LRYGSEMLTYYCTLRFLPLARLVFDDSTSKLSSYNRPVLRCATVSTMLTY
jgi:hypothetical protein